MPLPSADMAAVALDPLIDLASVIGLVHPSE
jgi:hypothetical protein